MDAVGYYATKDLSVIRDWAYSEYCVDAWKRNAPHPYPSFQEWRDAARRLDDETLDLMELREDRRNLIKASRRVHPRRLSSAVGQYVKYKILAYWASAALRDFPRLPEPVAQELERICPGYLDDQSPHSGNTQLLDSLIRWVEDRRFHRAKREGWFEVLLYQAQLHPRCARAKAYWTCVATRRAKGRRSRCPSLASWTAAVDAYTFEPVD